jgi:hypothetical protein
MLPNPVSNKNLRGPLAAEHPKSVPHHQAQYPPPQATTVVQTILEAARDPITELDILSAFWGAGRGCKVGRAGKYGVRLSWVGAWAAWIQGWVGLGVYDYERELE